MSPRFATAFPRTRTRGLSAPTLAALAAVAVVVTGMFASMVITVRTLDASSKAGRKANEMTQTALQLERLVVDLETGVRGYLLTDDTDFLAPYEHGRSRIDAHVGDLQRLTPPELEPRVSRLHRDLDAYITEYTEPLIRSRDEPALAPVSYTHLTLPTKA